MLTLQSVEDDMTVFRFARLRARKRVSNDKFDIFTLTRRAVDGRCTQIVVLLHFRLGGLRVRVGARICRQYWSAGLINDII